MERDNIYLIGFMGAGKSTVAPQLAEALDLDWLDTDDLVEEKAGLSIPEIFDYYGEERFREIEREVIQEVSQGEGKVVAVGGGAPMDNGNWSLLKSTGEVVYLEISPGEIMERVSSDGSRPLLANLNREEKRSKIRKLLKIRHPRYSKADHIILCDGAGTGGVVEEVAQNWQEKMKTVEVGLKDNSYPILIKASSLSEVGSLIDEKMNPARGALITDETVERLYGDRLTSSLESGGLDFEKLVVEPGEGSKSLETAESLYEKLAQLNLHRDSLILTFGGGVVGDLAGFVGSTFLRGLSVIQIPTTLLAQVDSSMGGKTAVNLSRGKNLVGTFHQPELVIIDPEVLTTLSKSDVRSGLGEVLKYGLIRDEDFFWRVANNKSLFDDFDDYRELEKIISRCCEIKAEVVTEDELDKGIRRTLNFGHTLGHGVEAGTGYGEIKHGEAVIWGMIGESWISRDRGYLEEDEFQDLVGALTAFNLPPLPEDLSEEELLKYVKRDKKVRTETIHSVLIKGSLGNVVVEEVEEDEITDAWNFLMELEVEG